MRQWATRKKCKFVYLRLDNFLPRIIVRQKTSLLISRMDPHCFDPDPDPYQNLDPDPDPGRGGGGGRSAKNVLPPWQNPR